MTEQETPPGGTPRPIPDLGFFAGAARPGGSSSFGRIPAQANSSPGPSGFTTPSVNQFGTATAAPLFGTPQPMDAWTAGPPGTAKSSMSSSVKVVAIVIGLVLIAGAVTVGRFGWRQFVADPVVPDTLQGLPLITDPSVKTATRDVQDSVAKDLTAGSKAAIGLYSDGRGVGYMLFALRGSSRPGQDNSDDELKNVPKTTHGAVACYAMPSAPQNAVAATMCIRSFFRRAVIVIAYGVTRPDPAMVARATDEAWKAQ